MTKSLYNFLCYGKKLNYNKDNYIKICLLSDILEKREINYNYCDEFSKEDLRTVINKLN